MQDLVKVDNYVSHTSFLQPVMDYRKKRYPSVRPASTTVAVHFPFPSVLEEIDAWAYLGPKEYINPKTVFDTAFRGSSQAVKAGDTLYLTGQTARDIKTQIVGRGDIKAQTVQVFENIKNILEGAGATFDNVVKLLIFVSHPTHLAAVREVRSRYLKGNRPAITSVMVDFSDPGVMVEVDTWAYLG
ncbi:MAG: RidA family protein [Chloroflexi bacterium]|nr:RidA family protein [Chloroflexota bacterium]